MESSPSLPSLNTYEIDEEINKSGIYNKKEKSSEINAVFKLIKNLTQDELKTMDENSSFPKYFCQVGNKNFKYIGVLTNQLKRDVYGYSLMDNNDEYIGEFKEEMRNGFGIYKFKQNEDEEEIYIGEYINNKKEGKGMYIKINKTIKDDSNGNLILVNYISGIGTFKDNLLTQGIFYSLIDNKETYYLGKLNELGEQDDNEALYIEDKNKIFKGKINKGNMVEGRNIFVNDKYEKVKGYYFIKTKNEKNGENYEFNSNKNEEGDEECIKKTKEFLENNYDKKIQEIFNGANDAFNKFKDYNKALNVDFENEIKNKIKNELDKILIN